MSNLTHTRLSLAALIVMWLCGIGGFALFILSRLPITPEITQFLSQPHFFLSRLFTRWDASWYLIIAQHGYFFQEGTQSSVVFFPLYPFLIQTIGSLLHSFEVASYLISGISLTITTFALYRLVSFEKDPKTAWKTITLLLTFPLAFFLIAPYTESLFLMLAVGAWYLARRERWWEASILVALLAITRVSGILIVIPLLIEYYLQHRQSLKNFFSKDLLAFLIMPVALIAHLWYLAQEFGNPFIFSHAQEAWHRNSTLSWSAISSSWQHYFSLFQNPPDAFFITNAYTDLTFLGIFAIGVILCWIYLRKTYALYATLLLILPILSGRPDSIGRYMLGCFPIFIALGAATKNQGAFLGLMILQTIFLAFFLAQYVQGYWVA